MASDSPVWLFTQLTSVNGAAKKSFMLSGPQAPHGRPRQKPIVSTGIELREKTVYYPDNNVPTRHVFGVKYDDWELQGRFRDAHFGAKGASNNLVDQILAFVKDGQQCRISWGSIISVTGLIKSFKPNRESVAEVPWTMRILIDAPSAAGPQTLFATPTRPSTTAQRIAKDLQDKIVAPLQSGITLRGLTGEFIDGVETVVSAINTVSGTLVDAANEIDNFQNALIGQIERVRGGIHQLTTAIVKLRNLILSRNQSEIQIVRDSESDISWSATSTRMQITAADILAILEDLDNAAEVAQRRHSLKSYVSKLGDSWESISIKFYGGPSGAGKIRDANGVRYGDQPIPGRIYIIPL